MQDNIYLSGNPEIVRHIGFDERETFTTEVVFDVSSFAGDQVIDRDDLVAPIQQRVPKVRTQETRTAGNYDSRH